MKRGELSLKHFARQGQSRRSRNVGKFTCRMGALFGKSVLVWQHLVGSSCVG